MYKEKQQQLLIYTCGKVRKLLQKLPTPGHGFDHAIRTARFCKLIAKFEHQDIFLAELSGLLHDVGYTKHVFGSRVSHHELSYELVRQWFREDRFFDSLTKQEKYIILYSIRYHGNDDANKYSTAWILRDADKLDGLGAAGLKRARDYCVYTGRSFDMDVRCRFHIVAYLKSAWSKKLVTQKKLLQPFQNVLTKLNRARIKPIVL